MEKSCLVCHNKIIDPIKIVDIYPYGLRSWVQKKFDDYYIDGAEKLMHQNTFSTYSTDFLCKLCLEKLKNNHKK